MKTNRPLLLSAFLATAVLSPLPAQPEAAAAELPESTLTFSFPGGALSEFVALLREKSGAVNILLSEKDPDPQVPTMALKNVTLEAALEAMEQLVDSREVNVDVGRLRSPAAPIFVVRVQEKGEVTRNYATSVGRPGSDSTVQVFSLSQLVGGKFSAETLLTAIDAGLGIMEGAPEATVRYHRDSGMLFVRGTHDQVGLVRQTLNEAREDVLRSRHGEERSGAADEAPEEQKDGASRTR